MPSILDALPTQGQKEELLGGFGAAITPEALGLDKLQQLDVAGLAASFPVGDIQSFKLGSLPPLPAALSRNGVLQQLQQPLDRLKSINAAFLLEELGSYALVALPTPTFRIVDAVGEITGVILPTTIQLNSEEKPTTWTVDLTADKTFDVKNATVQIFTKIDNLFDRKNEFGVFGDTGRATNSLQKRVDAASFQGNPAFLDRWYTRPDFFSEPRRVTVGVSYRF